MTFAAWSAQKREAKGLSSRLRASFAEATGERRGVAPGSFVDLLVNATDKATGESFSDLERTNQAFVMVMSGEPRPILPRENTDSASLLVHAPNSHHKAKRMSFLTCYVHLGHLHGHISLSVDSQCRAVPVQSEF